MNIVNRERETYRDMWSVPVYSAHSPGERFTRMFLDMMGERRQSIETTILDAGCGSGKGALALRSFGFNVRMCDLTDEGLIEEAKVLHFDPACLWKPLAPQLSYALAGKFDWVYCCDVMEHIPPTFTMLVVSRLLEVARYGVFFSISLVPDSMGVWIGKPLHQTLQPFIEWRDQLNTVGEVIEARDLLNAGVFLVKPR